MSSSLCRLRAALAIGCLVTLPLVRAQSTTIVSTSAAGLVANGPTEEPWMSANGRFVYFRSWATNLAPGDPDATFDAYVKDRQTGAIELVSVDSNGVHAAGLNLTCGLSADGNLACFQSNANNVVPGDTGSENDIFVRNRMSGTTTMVSVDANGVHGNDDSETAAISPNGRFVAFRSRASNLVANDTNNEWDVFVKDRQTGGIERANLGPGNAEVHGDSYVTSLSFDGRFVLFSSVAPDIVPNDTNNERDIFLRDRLLGVTRRVSVTSAGGESNGDSHAGYLSADGRFATFVSSATNLVAMDTNGVQDVFVHELSTGITTRISVSSSGVQSNGFSTGNGISADGRYVAMASTATTLVPGDAGFSDVYVHDRHSGQTTRVGLTSAHSFPNGDSHGGAFSADARYVTFFTAASNVAPGVAGGHNLVYVRDRGPASPFTPLCAGDFGSACPCGNNSQNGAGEGCTSSFALGGKLRGSGMASLATDTLVLAGTQMPSAACLYFQGTSAQNSGLGSVFGDGLRCASGTITRLRQTINASGASQYPAAGDPAVSVRGGVMAPGTRIYQVWYRNAATFCTPSTFNVTNGLWVAWTS